MFKYDNYIKLCKEKKVFIDEKSPSHYILYNENHLNNYYYALYNLKDKSDSGLKYSRKIFITHNDKEYTFLTSDIHIDVDFELLGVNETSVFFQLFKHIKENIVIQKKIFYICCIHFNIIKLELLEFFHIFINEPNIKFIFLTDQISFLPDVILKNSIIKKHIINYKSFYNRLFETRIQNIANNIIDNTEMSLFIWREKLYELLILNDNIYDCFSYLIELLIQDNYIKESSIDTVLLKYYEIMYKYNNNYRSIYHLEHFIIFLRNLKK